MSLGIGLLVLSLNQLTSNLCDALMIDDNVFVIDSESWVVLNRIKSRLYDDRILSFDQRRDLAKLLDDVISNVVELSSEELLEGK